MEDNELYYNLLLKERIRKIQTVIRDYYEEYFYIAFSGGKDSTVLSALIDLAIPDNKIPRVYADTGIELNLIRNFVYDLQKQDDRIIIIKPSKNIKQTLETYGYPFKSKVFSKYVERFRRLGKVKSIEVFIGEHEEKQWSSKFSCPDKLKYLFSYEYTPTFPISMECCIKMKENPMLQWQKINNKKYPIIGVMREEGGGRINANCMNFTKTDLKSFQPLVKLTKDWENWFIEKYNIQICSIYYPPYSFERTGCKGCPFNPNVQTELNVLQQFFPEERKQCEYIWKPVYEEYRRINYRLK